MGNMYKWAGPAFGVRFQPIQDFKRFFARLFNDRKMLCRSIKDFLVFGIGAGVFGYHNVYIEVSIDQFLGCVAIAVSRQNYITIATENFSGAGIIASVQRKPGIIPEVG